jgi:hypothetical protein
MRSCLVVVSHELRLGIVRLHPTRSDLSHFVTRPSVEFGNGRGSGSRGMVGCRCA